MIQQLLLILCILTSTTSLSSDFNQSARDWLRAGLEERIVKQSGALSSIGCNLLSTVATMADCTCAALIDFSMSFGSARSIFSNFAFADDNNFYTRYDHFGVFTKIPDQGVSSHHLSSMLAYARDERDHWKNGKLSGAIYDGSLPHMKLLAENFKIALTYEPNFKELLKRNEALENLWVDAFYKFNSSNPLHGTSFPLSVKAIREFGLMMANLFGANYAIANSGDGLRVGLQSLKNRTINATRKTTALVVDDGHEMKTACDTLNIRSILLSKSNVDDSYMRLLKQEIDFIVVNLNENDTRKIIDATAATAVSFDKEIHLHLSSALFARLLTNSAVIDLQKIFSDHPSIASISVDTNGIIYGGITATIFRDAWSRWNAFEAHIDWVGGIYPGITNAGSIPGIDFILAYLQVLYLGKGGLQKHVEDLQPENSTIEIRAVDKFAKNLVRKFYSDDKATDLLDELRTTERTINNAAAFRELIEHNLLYLSLSIFNASDTFVGRITSGGTESIRVAMQTYLNRHRALNAGQQPIFLMTSTAHVAFERHLKTNDAVIERIKTDQFHRMDPAALERTINKLGKENIAAIVISAPAYPHGIYDDIKAIAAIAYRHDVPLHVDACLGGFLTQFVDDNSQKIDLSAPEFAGVTSISADQHKYGYFQKGISTVGLRKDLTEYLAKLIAAPRSVTSLLTGLFTFMQLGSSGYQERANKIAETARSLKTELQKIEEISLVDNPHQNLNFVIAFTIAPLSSYTMNYLLSKLGWRFNPIGENTLHIALTSAHANNSDFVSTVVEDIRHVIDLMKRYPNFSGGAKTALYGMSASLPNLPFGTEICRAIQTAAVKSYAENIVTR